MVEADAELTERSAGGGAFVCWCRPDERAVAEQVHGVVQLRVGVLVDHRLGVEERLVPGDADREVADGEGHVGERWEIVMGASSSLGAYRHHEVSGSTGEA